MTEERKNEEALKNLFKVLSKTALSASEICEKTGYSKPTVYAQIDALTTAGCKIRTRLIRCGSTGPLAKSYSVLISDQNKIVLKRFS